MQNKTRRVSPKQKSMQMQQHWHQWGKPINKSVLIFRTYCTFIVLTGHLIKIYMELN